MPISEQDAILALQAARAFSDDPAKVAKAKTIHDAYKRQQEAAGKPLWPETERAKVEDATKMRAMFQDRERHGFDEETFSEFSATFPDPEKKARFLNSQFLSRVFQRSTDEIRSLGTQYRDEYAKQTWGEPVKTEGEFYEKLAGDFDLEDEIGKAAQDAALSGTSELDALSKFDFENVENPAYTARKDHRRQQFSKAFQAVKSELSGLEPTARVFTDQLKKQMGASGEAGAALPDEWFVETVMSLPKEKRDVFLSIVAKRGGEGEQKTLFQAMAERFGRQATSMVRNVGTASILKGLDEMGRQVIAGKLSASELPEEFGIEPFDFLAGEAKDNRAPKSEISGIRVPVEGSDEFAALPPEKQEALRRLERERDYLLTYEKINRIATGAVDAAEGSNYYAKGLLGISSSAPNILLAGAGPVGIGLNVKSYQDQALVDISDANPGLSMSTARAMAGVQGLGQGLIDMIPAKIAAGKLPGVTRWMNQAVATGKSAATRAGVRAIGGATFEAGVELTQDVGIPGAVQSLAAELDEDVPGYNWGERFAEFTSEESLSELIPSFLALSLIGAGVGSVRDFKSARSLLADPDWLKAMKISEAGTSEIRAKVIAGDMEGAQTLFREEFRKSGEDQKPLQQAAAEAIPRLIERREALRELVNRAGDIDLLPAIRNNGEGSWSLEYNDGSGISFQTYEEADARRWQVASDENLSLHEDTRETIRRIDSDLEAGRELKYLFALDAPTLGDAQARGDVTAEDAANRLDIADATTPELDAEFEEATVAANLAGLSREERAASARILGSSTNEFRDGIVRTTMRLYQGATPLTIIEEKTEGDAKFMVRQLGLRKWMVSSLREWERVTGDRVFRAVAAGEETDQDIVEAWSAMAQAYFIGRNKDGEGVGWNRAKLAKALQTSLAGPLTGYARLFNAVLKRAAMIEKAKADGTFDGDLEQFLERSTGMSEQRRFERAVVKEGGGIANELSQTDSKSIDGATFSIADFSDSRAQPQDGDVTLFQDGTRLVGPTTFSILAYHGTPHKVDKFSTENIGTGEGAQVYGWGLYFAQDQFVARDYKNKLGRKLTVDGEVFDNSKPRHRASFMLGSSSTPARAIERLEDGGDTEAANILRAEKVNEPILKDTGNLYTVRLKPDDDQFLDWDKPLSEQSEYIKRTFDPIVRKYILENDAIVRQEFKDSVSEGSVLGSKLYQTISGERQIETRATDSRKAGSEFLLESGIKGIRYLDGNSRNQGQGSYNYVIFDENDIEILEENGQPVKREEVGPTFSILPTSESDARYLELAKDPEGNRVELQRMVDEAAKKAGYNVGPVFHGTNARFTVFSKGGRLGIYATPDESLARQYGERVLRIFAKVNRGARIDAELTTAESAKSGVDQLVSLLEKFDAIQAYPKEGNREILFREDVSLKSADPITYDESGNVIPLSQRFDSTRDEITYSILPADGNLDDTFARMFSPFQRSPELRMKLGFEMRDRAIGISRQVAPIIRANRTKGSIEAERKTRENDIFGEKLEALGGAFVSQLDAANLDDASARPILAELLRRKTYQRKDGKVVSYWGGSLMSKGEAKRRGMDTTGGEWDDIPEGLPGYVWGGGLSPDQAAAMLGFDSIPAFWTALQSEIDSFKAIQQQAEEANREISRLRKEAREESQTWADRALKDRETVGTDRATLLAFLRTLEAITRALPAEVRGKIGGAVALARLKGPGAMLDEIESRVKAIDRELEIYLKKQADEALDALLEKIENSRTTKPGEVAKAKATPEVYKLVDELKIVRARWSAEEGRAEAEKIQGLIDTDGYTAEEIGLQMARAELIPLFAGWHGKTEERERNGKTVRVKIADGAGSAQRMAAVETLTEIWKKAKLQWAEEQARYRERRQAIREGGITEIRMFSKSRTRDEQEQMDRSRKGLPRKFAYNIMSFDGFFRWFMGDDSLVYKAFTDGQRKAENEYTDAMQRINKGIEDFFTETFGGGSKLKGRQVAWKMAQKTATIKPDVGEVRTMSQMEMVTAQLMWRQEDGKRHMRGIKDDEGNVLSDWSYDEGFMKQVNEAMTDEAWKVLDMLTDLYAAEYEPINRVYRKMFGVDMPKHQLYAPLTVIPTNPKSDAIDPLTGFFTGGLSGVSGSFKTRGTSTVEPDFKDALSVFIAHTMQMEHFKAFGEFAREFRAITGNAAFRKALEQAGGDQAVATLSNLIEEVSNGGIRNAGRFMAIEQTLDRVGGRIAQGILFGRLQTIALNITQLGAASVEMSPGAYLGQLRKLLTGQLDWLQALRTPYIQRRIAEMPPIIRQAIETGKGDFPNRLRQLAETIGYGISASDGFFTAATYVMTLDHQMSLGRKRGLEGPELERWARNETERIVDRIAQPTRKGARSVWENNATGAHRTLASFISEARKNAALLHFAFTKGGKEGIARTGGYLLFAGIFSELLRTGWRDLRDDEEGDDDWNLSAMIANAFLDPLYGIPIFGGLIQDFVKAAAGEKTFSGTILESGNNAIPAARRLLTWDYSMDDIETTVSDVNKVLGAIGSAFQPASDAKVVGNVIEDAAKILDNLLTD